MTLDELIVSVTESGHTISLRGPYLDRSPRYHWEAQVSRPLTDSPYRLAVGFMSDTTPLAALSAALHLCDTDHEIHDITPAGQSAVAPAISLIDLLQLRRQPRPPADSISTTSIRRI